MTVCPGATRRARRAISTPTLATTLPTPARRRSRARWAAASAATAPVPTASRFAGLNGTAGTVGPETVTYSWTAGTDTLTATITSGRAARLFTVQLTDPATGAYKVTLLDNVMHAGGPNDEADRCDQQPDLHDHRCGRLDRHRHAHHHLRRRCADGDDEASQNVAEGATVTGTLDFVQGADGATVTHIGGTALVFNPATAITRRRSTSAPARSR